MAQLGKTRTLALLLAGLFAWTGWAEPATHGREFNLVSKKLDHIFRTRMNDPNLGDVNRQKPTKEGEWAEAKKFADEMLAFCEPKCRRTEHPGKFDFTEWKFEFESGFQFNIAVDPGTVEVQVGDWPTEQWRAYEGELQKYLYDFPSQKGLNHQVSKMKPSHAHHNVGTRSAFGENGRAYAHHVADYSQYPELAGGLLGEDDFNGPTMDLLKEEQRLAADQVFDEISQKPNTSILEVATAINQRVYTWTPDTTTSGQHSQAFAMKYVSDPGRLASRSHGDVPYEKRSVREPLSAAENTLQLELEDLRIAYNLGRSAEPIAFRPRITRLRGGQAVDAFYMYLGDMGAEGDFKKFRKLLPEKYISTQPSPLLTGKELAALYEPEERLLERVHHSSFVRKRIREFLLSRKDLAPEIFEKTVRRLIPHMDSDAEDPVRQLVASVDGSHLVPPPLRRVAQTAPITAAPLDEALLANGAPSAPRTSRLNRCVQSLRGFLGL